MMNICSIFSQRDVYISYSFLKKLILKLNHLIEKENVKIFLLSDFGSFNKLCYKILLRLKTKIPDLVIIFCLFSQRSEHKPIIPKWINLVKINGIIYPDMIQKYTKTNTFYRNYKMIDMSDFIITYYSDRLRNIIYIPLEYAKVKNKNIINLFKTN